ncbi:MAG: signal peptide peptidase SppA, partial [Myxococcota bacterium]
VFEQGFVRGRAAVEAGLVDDTCYEDELSARLSIDGRPARPVRAPRYLGYREGRFFRPVLPRPFIAVVELTGVIADEVPAGRSRGVDLARTVRTLRAVRKERRAVGVVLHIDSPGGSATASDLIHREVQRLAERKPVVAVFGNVAASGGYYVAAPAHAIVAQPVTITGSIGVVSARLLARDLLERIGIKTETVRTAPHADMFSPSRELDDAERALIEREIDAFYQAFVQVVARGRGRSTEEVDRVARGRVWAAVQAAGNGLVDRLGGMREAVDEVRSRLPVPHAVQQRLRPRLVAPSHEEQPPPEPPPQAAPDTRALVDRLAPEALALVDLAAGPSRVLYYASDLPVVR